MTASRPRLALVVSLVALAAAVSSAPRAAGFAIMEQGSKALGMGNAYTALGDDPSVIYFSTGAVAFHQRRHVSAGATAIFLGDSQFAGAAPFPGPGATADQENSTILAPHLYWIEPLGDRFTFGLGVTAPFGLVTEWERRDTFPGRFISQRAELRAVDLTPTIGWRAADTLGLTVGVIGRFSDLTLERRAPAINPFTFLVEDAAQVKLESDVDSGLGWTAGLQHRPTDRLRWGISYRSTVELDYEGSGRLTPVQPPGDPFGDALLGKLPFNEDLPIATSIEFPDSVFSGIGYWFTDRLWIEYDFHWWGWSTFDTTEIRFLTAPALDSTIVSRWDDARQHRIGATWDWKVCDGAWRFGLYHDETPQPEAAVSPLLPDADRIGYSAGYGFPLGRTMIDLAALFVDFDERTTSTNSDGFFGTYDTDVLLLSGTVSW